MTLIIGFDPPPVLPQGYRPPPPSMAYRLDAAGEKSIALNPDGRTADVVVPGLLTEDYQGNRTPMLVLPGATSPDWPVIKTIIREHAFRVCPWAVLWAAPGFLGSADWCGKAWGEQGIALVRTDRTAPFILDTAFHETWHLLEEWLPPDLLAKLDAALGQGPAYRLELATWTERPKPYLGLAWERRARAFAHLAMLHVEGAAPPGATWGNSAWSILARAWTGELGTMAAERREAAQLAEQRRIAASKPRRFIHDRRGRIQNAA